MFAEVKRFCRAFADAFMDDDYARAAEWTQPPVAFATATDHRLFADRDQLAAELKACWGPHRRAGAVVVQFDILSVRSFVPTLVQADIKWRHMDARGQTIKDLHSTYTFRHRDGDLALFQIVAHNESLHRPV